MPEPRRRKFWTLILLAAGFVLLAAIIGGRAWVAWNQRQDMTAVASEFALEERFSSILNLLQDAETGQRGYLLTNEESYLEPYRHALAQLPAELDALGAEAAADPSRDAEVAALRRLAAAKLAELKQTVTFYRDNDPKAAMGIVKSDRGKAIMDRIRAIVAGMRKRQKAYIAGRLARSAEDARWLNIAGLLGVIGVIAIGFVTLASTRRRFQELAAAHSELETGNRRLLEEIVQREKAEEQIRQMHKIEAIGQLTGGIAHDFNNVLAVILSAMSLIQRKLARGETDLERFIGAAIDAANRAAALTARLLAFARQQPLSPKVIDANKLIGGMSDLLRRTLGAAVEVETVLAGGLWRTRADANQLENAVINLAVNARDAMPEGGKMTIETGNCHLDDAYAAAHYEVPAGQYVQIAVTDTGAGMPPEVVARAFDPFFTTKPTGKGTGLGLSQVFGFVRQSGGHVKIYSEAGEGTTVKIYLPRHFGEAAEVVAATAGSSGGRAGETILVVEDDDSVRLLAAAALRDLGYVVIEAAAADRALEFLAERPEIALLFTDVVMPGKSGRMLADAAREMRSGLKVLFTTGFTRNAVVHNGVLDPGVDFLAKPYTVEQLAQKVRDTLHRP